MNIQQLRQSLKVLWLNYYREHRDWLTRIGVWVTCEGKRRPSSSFILATLSILEPKLTELLPLVVDLSSNPDRIVIALGLNFNPDEELEALERKKQPSTNGQMRMLPGRSPVVDVSVKPAVPVKQAVPVKPAVLAETQPVVVEPAPQKPTEPQRVAPSDADSPFGNVPDALIETPEAEPSTALQTAANPQPPSARPVMDTVELAAGELPQREVSAADDSCEGVRSHSAVRHRKDSR